LSSQLYNCKIKFQLLQISNIPQLGADDHNQALRFITLIDCLYENKTKLICTAEVVPEALYTGSRNKFEFARTISRLREMQTTDYLQFNQ
jgi:cell division protein ZapE